MPAGIYGNLIRLDTGNGIVEEVLERVPLYVGVSQGGVSEDTLQDLLFRFPRALPISAIDATYGDAIPVCRELPTPTGFLDALYVNHLGWLTLAEFKLWRNPQARREVIGQILDYAKDLASWGYEDLQRRVSLATGRKGNALYELVREHHPDLDEAEFVDGVTRHLRRGEFLLLIIGDGIQEGAANIVDFVQRYSGLHFNLALVEAALYRDGIQEGAANIVDFVQRYSGLHFNLALVEAALYRDGANRLIVQPRILAQTEIVQRFVVDGSVERVAVIDDADTQQETLSAQDEENLRFWTAVLRGYDFADVTAELPPPVKNSTLSVTVRHSGFAGWGLCFGGYIHRSASDLGCYLTARKDQARDVRIFDELAVSFKELRAEMGDDLQHWTNAAGRPRIGFRRPGGLAFLSHNEESSDFRDAVSWMRERLDRLVSTLNPKLQARLADDR